MRQSPTLLDGFTCGVSTETQQIKSIGTLLFELLNRWLWCYLFSFEGVKMRCRLYKIYVLNKFLSDIKRFMHKNGFNFNFFLGCRINYWAFWLKGLIEI